MIVGSNYLILSISLNLLKNVSGMNFLSYGYKTYRKFSVSLIAPYLIQRFAGTLLELEMSL